MLECVKSVSEDDLELKWSLDNLENKEKAIQFFYGLNNLFPIYSKNVEKIYTEYTVDTIEIKRTIVVLPNYYNYDSMFNYIPDSAVHSTNIRIVPGSLFGGKGYYIVGKARGQEKTSILPFKKGIKAMLMGYYQEGIVLPLLMNGDLREIPKEKEPMLKVHNIKIKELLSRSEFEKKDIEKSIKYNLSRFFSS